VAVGIAADEALAASYAAGQIGMTGINAGIQDGDGGRAADRHTPVGLVPGDLRQSPLLSVGGIVGSRRDAQLHRRRHGLNLWMLACLWSRSMVWRLRLRPLRQYCSVAEWE